MAPATTATHTPTKAGLGLPYDTVYSTFSHLKALDLLPQSNTFFFFLLNPAYENSYNSPGKEKTLAEKDFFNATLSAQC